MSRYLFKFIGGKYEGGQVQLPDTGEVGIGRAQELGICLVEDMVSRHHAKIDMSLGQVVLTDLNSTNGTFVNGERIQKVEIEHDDRVLVGTSIMRLVDTGAVVTAAAGIDAPRSATSPAPAPQLATDLAIDDLEIQIDLDDAPTPGSTSAAAADATAVAAAPTHAMSGDLADVPLTDLLQLLSGNQRSGEVQVDGVGTALVRLHQGKLTSVAIADKPQLSAIKALCRVLRWSNGSFAFSANAAPSAPTDVPRELAGRLEEVLMEATRQNDEAARLRDPLGGPELLLQVAQPLGARLADQSHADLDLLQQIWAQPGLLDSLLDAAPEPDSDVLTKVLRLRDLNLVTIVDP